MGKLQDGACYECLNSPKRGPQWVQLARRVRQDPAFALAAYERLTKDKHRLAFIGKYGLPPGAQDPRPSAEVLSLPRR